MIRLYKDSDIENIVATWRIASDFAHPFLTKDFQDKEAENVRNIYPQYAEIWVKEIEGRVIGFTATLPHDNGEIELGAIFLRPNYHGQGIGREMMDFIVQRHGSIILDVFEKNSVGRKFYDKYGFEETASYVHEPTGQLTIKLAFNKKT